MTTKAVWDTVTEYGSVSTINGVLYVFEERFNRLVRAFWFIVGIILIIVSYLLIQQAYNTWLENPILTTVKTTGYPIRNLEFPAITICGLGHIDSFLHDGLTWQVMEYVSEKNGATAKLDNTSNYKGLLQANGLKYEDFLAEKYPGLNFENFSLEDILVMTTSPKPDNRFFNLMDIINSIDDICEEDISSNDIANPCDGNLHAYDETTGFCYRLAGTGTTDQVYDGSFCTYEEDLFYIIDDLQLQGMAAIISNASSLLSPLSVSNNTFLTSAERNDVTQAIELTDAYSTNTYTIFPNSPDSPLNYITLATPLNNSNEKCFTLQYQNSTGKFEGITSLCNVPQSVVCVKLGAKPSMCYANATTTNRKKRQLQSSMNDDTKRLEYMLNPRFSEAIKKLLQRAQQSYREEFVQIDRAKAYANLFELLWYTQIPCFDTITNTNSSTSRAMLKNCMWKGQPVPCAAIFSAFPTDMGMCCTFNMESADQILQNSSYQRLIKRMQDRDKTLAKESTLLPPFYTEGSEPVPQAGINKGLSLMLDAHTDLLSPGSVTEDFQGFVAIIGSQDYYPLLHQKHIQIYPGRNNLIGITAINVQSSDSIRHIASEKRHCYFRNEYKLKLHSNYSQFSCLLECQIDYARNVTTAAKEDFCTPWFLPTSDDDINICDPWEAENFMKYMLDVPDKTCAHCLPDCQFTSYQRIATTLPFRRCDEKNLGVTSLCNLRSNDVPKPPIFGDQVLKSFGVGSVPPYAAAIPTNYRIYNTDASRAVFPNMVGDTYDAYEKDIATVNFYFETSTVFQYKRDLTMTWTDFLGILGGLLGLCNGFSLCSAVEIVFWFTYVLWSKVAKSQKGDERKKESRLDMSATQMSSFR